MLKGKKLGMSDFQLHKRSDHVGNLIRENNFFFGNTTWSKKTLPAEFDSLQHTVRVFFAKLYLKPFITVPLQKVFLQL